MSVTGRTAEPGEQQVDKGLKSGALGLISTTIIATASVAPAYSLAATLAFVVAAVALQSPAVAVLAFVPMLLTSIGYSELNKADPDCGTTFTWATRAFGPKTGWFGGWAIVVADVLVMASLAQVAGQYVFLLFSGPSSGIGTNPTSGWVLLAGVIWIILMTTICYIGIEVSANFQKVAADHRDRHAAGAVRHGAGQGRYRARAAGPPHAEPSRGSTRSTSPRSARSRAASS